MKKLIFSAILAPAAIVGAAQTAMDAYQLSGNDLSGTARFTSMAGAFTALGGDISAINQNPAGIGVYRKNDIALTLDLGFNSSKTSTPTGSFSDSKTRFTCKNFGYVGSANLESETFRTFNWGVSYSRVADFTRNYHIGNISNLNNVNPGINGSLTNYIANLTDGIPPSGLLDDVGSRYNPYFDSSYDWLSILAYNSYMINPIADGSTNYVGLWQDGASGNMNADVSERGSVDEYNISFGGNIMDIVYWGLGVGITDLNFTQETNYSEEISGARVPNATATSTETGNGYFNLHNYRHVKGSGANFKIGVIVKPINEFRIGVAVHTPTYYSLSQDFYGDTQFSYSTGYNNMSAETEWGGFDWKLKSPWRFMVGAAGVVGGRFILSADYEMAAYNNMQIKSRGAYFDYTPENNDIKNLFKTQNTFRIGAEARITPQLSVRLGYSYQTSGMKGETNEPATYISTGGTQPAYNYDNDTQYITLGVGYRWSNFYIDGAFVNRKNNSTYHPYTGVSGYDIASTRNQIVVTLGYKF